MVFCSLYTNICCLSGYRKLAAMVYICSVPRNSYPSKLRQEVSPTDPAPNTRSFQFIPCPDLEYAINGLLKHPDPLHHLLVPPTHFLPLLPHLNPRHSPWKPLTSKRRPSHSNRNVVALVVRADRLKPPVKRSVSTPTTPARIARIRELTSQDRSPHPPHHP